MNLKKRKQNIYIGSILLLIIFLGIGYAYLNSTLSIYGDSKISKNTWGIHFENVLIQSDSTIQVQPIVNNVKDSVSFSVNLTKPGDVYHFTVDAKNAGTLDAMVSIFNTSSLTDVQKKYLKYTVNYQGGNAIQKNDKLAAGNSQTIEVFLGFKDDVTGEDLSNSTDETLNLSFVITYVQADDNAKDVVQPSFGTQSWDTIIANVRNGKFDNYHLGDTKEIDMGSFGKHTVRISNMSVPSECSTLPSQTACGFVVEFADIITNHVMNSTDTTSGGWEASELRKYLQNTIYPTLPADLRNGIVDTVISEGNTDKLYLLAEREVWGIEGDKNNIVEPMAWDPLPEEGDEDKYNTRKLDYYRSIQITTSNYGGAIKQYNGVASTWWLRSVYIVPHQIGNQVGAFISVTDTGYYWNPGINVSYGVSPAFRIG